MASSIASYFVQSLAAVGNIAVMTLCGVYLYREKMFNPDRRAFLAMVSLKVTFPLLLFTSIVYCPQDKGAGGRCTDIARTVSVAWLVLIWPFFVVGVGLAVGKLMAKVSNAPRSFELASMAAVAFGNSTGMPLTLVAVLYGSGSPPEGGVSPAVFISIYLIIYPVLQWSVGSWLLEPPKIETGKKDIETAVEKDIIVGREDDRTRESSANVTDKEVRQIVAY